MPDLRLLIFELLGCVYQRYVGVQITSTQPISMTCVMVNGNEVVMDGG